jgi:hypothetical protein
LLFIQRFPSFFLHSQMIYFFSNNYKLSNRSRRREIKLQVISDCSFKIFQQHKSIIGSHKLLLKAQVNEKKNSIRFFQKNNSSISQPKFIHI